MRNESCDIFCNVVDNYGDIGVCWRLARQLANEHGMAVRLWVDDLRSFGKLCPELDATLDEQHCRGVQLRHGAAKPRGAGATALHPLPQSAGFAITSDLESVVGSPSRMASGSISNVSGVQVRRWYESDSPFALRYRRVSGVDVNGPLRQAQDRLRYLSPNGVEKVIEPADLVIEAFACKLPQSYVEAMAARDPRPVWVNLEYLSAEDWVEGCHKLPSPHPTLPLTKYFFFPGFTEKTGGLLLERDLFTRRDAFQSDTKAQEAYWHSLGVPERQVGELRVSMFGYENEAMEDLLQSWEQGAQLITCLLPEGRSLPQVASYFGQSFGPSTSSGLRTNGSVAGPFDELRTGAVWQRGQLRVHVLPFVEQECFDELLWACDINFVRGEDSCVRSQWAAKPFIWQIYPQRDGVHLEKLEALCARYTAGLPSDAAQAVQDMWLAWNGGQGVAGAWQRVVAQRAALTRHGTVWARRLAPNNLALNLLDFSRQTE